MDHPSFQRHLSLVPPSSNTRSAVTYGVKVTAEQLVGNGGTTRRVTSRILRIVIRSGTNGPIDGEQSRHVEIGYH
ncbi:MAG: hypothetical protein IKH99_11365 [Prevotella sp.]|nr:hypothetical protein [Prevotella sp.]